MAPALLILLWAMVIPRADLLPDKKSLLLPPVNFTIKVTGLAQVLLRWEPNPDQEPKDVELGYHVRINAPQEDDYETRNTESKCVTILHQGFSASVQTIPWNGHSLLASNWVSAELKAPPDRVNPPVNVTAEIEGTRLSIQWEKPISAFPNHCFEYEVKIYNTRKNYFQTEKMTTNTFISIIDDISKYSVQVRAAVSSVCRQMGFWSEWSQPVYVGNDDQKPSTEWFLIVLMATICFIVLIFTLICKIGHLWTRLFPPVPAPKNSIKDFFLIVSPESHGTLDSYKNCKHIWYCYYIIKQMRKLGPREVR
ncbi:interleukin-5 receptor subunit alpha [Leptonychotes weddellii]|uniref:Interleukin-5 receptor subunit alpha n=1 Tax=Leptonychotes weddellii TaxID=9713 RepID=A0A2U3XW65_LEPWE|nr:interleukin-5 receptor subunit alpha [Leptonychotes weddellii]